LPRIDFGAAKIIFRKPNKSLASKVMNLTLMQKTKNCENIGPEDDREILKSFLKKVDQKELLNIKIQRKMPNPFVVKVLQIFTAMKGEKAEKWSEIQESIKPFSFKMDLWKLSHKRLESFKIQALNKFIIECDDLYKKLGEICPLANMLFQWMKWVVEKESRGKKVRRILKSRDRVPQDSAQSIKYPRFSQLLIRKSTGANMQNLALCVTPYRSRIGDLTSESFNTNIQEIKQKKLLGNERVSREKTFENFKIESSFSSSIKENNNKIE